MKFTWQNGRQLASFTKTGTTASYTYDDSGIRTSKTVNGVKTDYYLSGSSIVTQISGNDILNFFYDESGDVYGFEHNGSEYSYIRNAQNDIIGILNSTGEKVVSYDYDSWGNILSITGTLASTIGQLNPFRYRGYYYDNESGLYYLQSRYYDSTTSRFVNADSVAGVNDDILSYNIFAYCSNNPVNCVDGTGQGKIFNWIKQQYNNIKTWMNSKSTYSGPTIPSSNNIVSDICGTTVDVVDHKINEVTTSWKPKYAPRKNNNGATKVSTALGTASTALDIANTITAKNNNLNWQRMEKAAIQITAFAAKTLIAVGAGSAATILSGGSGGTLTPVAIAGGLAISQAGCYVVDLTTEWAYRKMEIE